MSVTNAVYYSILRTCTCCFFFKDGQISREDAFLWILPTMFISFFLVIKLSRITSLAFIVLLNVQG